MRFDGRSGDGSSHVDLETARETIAYIRDDLAGVEGLGAAADALSRALALIDLHRHAAPPRRRVPMAPRFVKRPYQG